MMNEYSYIDGQSVEDENYHYLFDETHKDYKEGELERFLFNNNSILTTDNDNGDYDCYYCN